MNTDMIRMMAENMADFNKHVETVAEELLALQGIGVDYIEDLDYFDKPGMVVVVYQPWPAGRYRVDSGCISMPIEYLWEENWKETERLRLIAEKKETKRLADLERSKLEKEQEEAREKRDRKEFARLKKKYEGE